MTSQFLIANLVASGSKHRCSIDICVRLCASLVNLGLHLLCIKHETNEITAQFFWE